MTVLAEVIERERWNDDASAMELAEKLYTRVLNRLRKRAAEHSTYGRLTLYDFNSVSEDHIQGSCFVEPNDSPREAKAKRVRSNCVSYSNTFGELTDSQFETLCARILTLWNVEEAYCTQSSGDQGIDFFGKVPFGEIAKPSPIASGAEKQMKVWLVGQAKNYRASQVSTKDIRELVGSVSLARSKTYSGSRDPLSRLQVRVCDPVIFLFFTTGSISKEALLLLSRAGIVGMDGQQLAIFLADHGVGLREEIFERERFFTWAFESNE